MAEPIAPATSRTETAATSRSTPRLSGNPSRVMPRNETTRAHSASSPPSTWKAFTGRNVLCKQPDGVKLVHSRPALSGSDALLRPGRGDHHARGALQGPGARPG